MTIQDQIDQKRVLEIDKAIDRIKWRFSQNKPFKANFNDVQALNSIITWVNRQKAVPIKETPLFAKMYIYLYGLFLKHYNADPIDPIPEQQLHRLLDKDLQLIAYEFWREINFDSLSRRLKPLSISGDKHPAFKTEHEKQAFLDNFDALPEKEKLEFWKDEYDFDTVAEILNSMIKDAINKFGNER